MANTEKIKYAEISEERRRELEFEAFIDSHIASCTNFTFETTLRSAITFEQARGRAKPGSICQ